MLNVDQFDVLDFNKDLMYEFYIKDICQKDAIRQYANHAVKEIKRTYGWDTDVQIHIEPEAKDKRLYSVSMSVFGLGNPIIVKKEGKQVMNVLRKVRKAVLRQIHRSLKRPIQSRRKTLFKEQLAS